MGQSKKFFGLWLNKNKLLVSFGQLSRGKGSTFHGDKGKTTLGLGGSFEAAIPDRSSPGSWSVFDLAHLFWN